MEFKNAQVPLKLPSVQVLDRVRHGKLDVRIDGHRVPHVRRVQVRSTYDGVTEITVTFLGILDA